MPNPIHHPLSSEPLTARASALLGKVAHARMLNASWAWDALAGSLDDYERAGGTLGHLALAAGVRAQECLIAELERSVVEQDRRAAQ